MSHPFQSFIVDRCPMYFNDGSNPWEQEENHIRVFNFNDDLYTSLATSSPTLFWLLTFAPMVSITRFLLK